MEFCSWIGMFMKGAFVIERTGLFLVLNSPDRSKKICRIAPAVPNRTRQDDPLG
jgi:hypothetical protein